MMNHRSTLAAAALAVVGLLAACSPADSESTEAPPTATTESAEGSSSETASEEEPAAQTSGGEAESAPNEGENQAAPSPKTDDDAEAATVEEGVVVPEDVDLENVTVDPERGPLSQEDVLALSSSAQVVVECDDPEALAANEGHEPAGWPAGVAEGEALPDPECHPDFIEVDSWDLYDEFSACCEGVETSTLVDTGMSEQERYRALWNQSQARADWSP